MLQFSTFDANILCITLISFTCNVFGVVQNNFLETGTDELYTKLFVNMIHPKGNAMYFRFQETGYFGCDEMMEIILFDDKSVKQKLVWGRKPCGCTLHNGFVQIVKNAPDSNKKFRIELRLIFNITQFNRGSLFSFTAYNKDRNLFGMSSLKIEYTKSSSVVDLKCSNIVKGGSSVKVSWGHPLLPGGVVVQYRVLVLAAAVVGNENLEKVKWCSEVILSKYIAGEYENENVGPNGTLLCPNQTTEIEGRFNSHNIVTYNINGHLLLPNRTHTVIVEVGTEWGWSGRTSCTFYFPSINHSVISPIIIPNVATNNSVRYLSEDLSLELFACSYFNTKGGIICRWKYKGPLVKIHVMCNSTAINLPLEVTSFSNKLFVKLPGYVKKNIMYSCWIRKSSTAHYSISNKATVFIWKSHFLYPSIAEDEFNRILANESQFQFLNPQYQIPITLPLSAFNRDKHSVFKVTVVVCRDKDTKKKSFISRHHFHSSTYNNCIRVSKCCYETLVYQKQKNTNIDIRNFTNKPYVIGQPFHCYHEGYLCNGPLSPNHKYKISLRVYSESGFVTVGSVIKFTDTIYKPTQAIVIFAVLLGLILLCCVLSVIVMKVSNIIRRKQNHMNDNGENEYEVTFLQAVQQAAGNRHCVVLDDEAVYEIVD